MPRVNAHEQNDMISDRPNETGDAYDLLNRLYRQGVYLSGLHDSVHTGALR
jgi:hypothetical protein